MFGFLIAVVAGFLTPHIETPLARPVARALEGQMTLEAHELRLIAFMIMLLAAAILSALMDTGSVFTVVLGAIIGYFLLRIVGVVKAAVDGKPRD